MIKRLTLSADEGKILTNGTVKKHMVHLFNEEIEREAEWKEIEDSSE